MLTCQYQSLRLFLAMMSILSFLHTMLCMYIPELFTSGAVLLDPQYSIITPFQLSILAFLSSG